MRNSEKQDLKRKLGRLGLFLLIVFVPCCVVEVLLCWGNVQAQWLRIMIIVIIMLVLYFLFLYVCSKLDKRKQERMKKKKDPFAD